MLRSLFACSDSLTKTRRAHRRIAHPAHLISSFSLLLFLSLSLYLTWFFLFLIFATLLRFSHRICPLFVLSFPRVVLFREAFFFHTAPVDQQFVVVLGLSLFLLLSFFLSALFLSFFLSLLLLFLFCSSLSGLGPSHVVSGGPTHSVQGGVGVPVPRPKKPG